MSAVKLELVTDPNSGFQAIYYDDLLLVDLGDNCNSRQDLGYSTLGDLLEVLSEKLGIEYEYITGYQLARKIWGPDWTEYETYWPENIKDVFIEQGLL